jgi:hypothetical protein
MVLAMEETRLRLAALAYVINIYDELTQETGAPPLGTQSQAVELILGDPELRRALAGWAADAEIDEATMALQRPPQDALLHRVRRFLEHIEGPPVLATANEPGR